MTTKLFRRARVFTPVDQGRPLAGPDQGRIRIHDPGAILCQHGLVVAVGPEAEVLADWKAAGVEQEIDCAGRAVIPGLVDPHTHMCFAGRRENEFARRLAGAEYLDILRQGGGILSTVRAVRAADEEELFNATRARALTALGLGTTTIEMKSGYGLETAEELKMLRVLARVGRETPLTVVPTFLGAHAVPPEYRDQTDDYVRLVIEEMLPAVAEQKLAGFCDVFCEQGVFSLEQSRMVLEAGRTFGLIPKMHADEVHDLGGAGLAAEVGAVSADHLLAAGEAGLTAMAAAGVIGVILPATAYSLRKPYAPARRMIELHVPLALATDCNPGSSFTESLPFVLGLAVMVMGLTVEEALTAATLNAAHALGLGRKTGSIEPGKWADLVILDGESPAVLAYHAGVSSVAAVYKRGELVA